MIYDIYAPDGRYMCTIDDNGRPGSCRPTNTAEQKFNPALPVWVVRASTLPACPVSIENAVDSLEQTEMEL